MSISTQDTFVRLDGRSRDTDAPCRLDNCNGQLVEEAAQYSCNECGLVVRHSEITDGEHTHKKYDNSRRWKMMGSYYVKDWEGSYSMDNMSEEDGLLTFR